MTKNKLTILSLAVVALIALPLSTTEIKEIQSHEAVLGTSTVALALNTENAKTVAKKPVVKKPVAKKKVVKKKKEKIKMRRWCLKPFAPKSRR